MVALRIALRYLFSVKRHRAVNIISSLSVAGLAVATMAIVVVLSVFNGFTRLAESRLGLVQPDFRLVPATGKTIAGADSLAMLMESQDAVAVAAPLLEERALAISREGQMPVRVKGVDRLRFPQVADLQELMVRGSYELADSIYGPDAAVMAPGVAMGLSFFPTTADYLDLYIPTRTGRINPAAPHTAYRHKPLIITGILEVQQPEYDADMLYMGIDSLRRLLDYSACEASAIDIVLTTDASPRQAAARLNAITGDSLLLLDRHHMAADTYRVISVEKWITFLMLIFILLIASFNIVSTMSLMVIEKRTDMSTLHAMGASRSTIGAVFAWEGWLITLLGGIIGCILGAALTLAQQTWGFVKLYGDAAALTIDAYPVQLKDGDIVLVLAVVAVVGLIMAFISSLFTRKIR